MLSQRTTQEGHGAYNIFRASSELLQHRNLDRGPSQRSSGRRHSSMAIPLPPIWVDSQKKTSQSHSEQKSEKNGRSPKVFPIDSDMPIKSIHDEPVPNDTENVRVLKLRDWLVGMHMGQYADNFVEAGFDDLDKVRQMTAKELGQVLTGSTAMTNHQCGELTKCIGQL